MHIPLIKAGSYCKNNCKNVIYFKELPYHDSLLCPLLYKYKYNILNLVSSSDFKH